MMAMDGLPLLRSSETAMPVKPRGGAPGRDLSAQSRYEASFEDTLQAEQSAETNSKSRRSGQPTETTPEAPVKRVPRERGPAEAEPKRRLHPTSVRQDVGSPETNALPQQAPPAGESEVPAVYRRPDFFEAPVDGSKIKSKVAVERFLTAMKTEVGVSADQVIRAMKSLPSEAMVASPDQNMHQILGALNLSAGKQASAENLYKGMVSQLGETNVSHDLERYSPKFLERQAWLDNVDQISQRFFLRNQDPMALAKGPGPAETSGEQARLSRSQDVSREPFGVALAPTAASLGVGLGAMAPIGAAAGARAGLDPQKGMSVQDLRKQALFDQQVSDLNGEVESVDLPPISGSMMKPDALLSSPGVELAPAAAVSLPTPAPQSAAILSSVVSPTSSTFLKGATGTEDEASDEKMRAESDAPLAGLSTLHRQEELTGSTEEFTPGVSTAQPKDPVENLRDLNQSAAKIAKEGGGEITMKLKPEGLGEVKLKVMVENGKVNVEMIADNPETKRILESQSFDLKKSLEGQMIQVDGLKIDVRDQQTQNERHSSQNQFDRELAKDFLGQFRDQNQSFRQSFFELPNVKAYRGTSKSAEDIRPTPAVRPRSDSNKRLNLVA